MLLQHLSLDVDEVRLGRVLVLESVLFVEVANSVEILVMSTPLPDVEVPSVSINPTLKPIDVILNQLTNVIETPLESMGHHSLI